VISKLPLAVIATSAALFATVTLAVVAPAATEGPPTISARVGPTLRSEVEWFPSREDVKRVESGLYTIYVYDRSTKMNFHLVGPGVDRRTRIAFRGSTIWRIRFRKGVYRFFCDRHERQVGGSFRVG
jgi:hypothetical protein